VALAQQVVGEVAADEACAADDEELLIGRRSHYFVDSHLVAARLRAGCEARRCQTTGARPSVGGVIRSGGTVGMTTPASAVAFVVAPACPTTPQILAPTFLASSSASPRFIEALFVRLPPPTENTSTASRDPRRETSSQFAKLVSHPSAFTRAVSSETLSVG